MNVVSGAIDEVGRAKETTGFTLVAEKGGVVLIEEPGVGGDHPQCQQDQGELAQQQAAPAAVIYGGAPQQQAGEQAEQQQVGPQLEVEQFGRLGGVGLEDVLQHVPVDQYAVAIHKVGGGGMAEQHQGQHGAQQPWPGDQRDEEHHQAGGDGEDGEEAEQVAGRGGREEGERLAPEGLVAAQHKEEGQ